MILNQKIVDLISQVPFVPIVTASEAGEPHLIVVGQVKEIRDQEILAFGIHKMAKTQENVKNNGLMQVVIASRQDGPQGYRLSGQACIEGNTVLFKAEKAEALI
ncbi:MAG: pyridoxamine 5'-phosphate oxidase family protein [Peptococcaceae bacterium]